jgi:uncharacterized membrane protein
MTSVPGEEIAAVDGKLKRMPRWLKITLVCSLAVNLLIVGLAVGAVLRHGHFGGGDRGVVRILRQIGPERREWVRDLVDARRPEIRALRDGAREARDAALDLFAADPFDAVAFRVAHERMLAADAKARAANYQLLPDIAGKLSAQDRRNIAGWLKRRRPH